MAKRIAKKVVWIGWDAADWKMINPLMDQGLMPNLEKMVNEGVMGNLATLDPPMSPTLWTAMATGKRPYKHGIHGFTEVDPSGEAVRPSYITSRKVKAIWNMMQHHGMKAHQVGWWPSHPAEPTDGVYISNFWHKAGKDPNNWPMAPGCVNPVEVEGIFSKLRVHPAELTAAHLHPFVPLAHEMDFENNPRYNKMINSIRKITADAASIQAAATYVLDNYDYDLFCVYFDAIDHYGHGFMKYNPPRRPHIPEDLYKYFKDVNISGYRYHDMILGRLLELAGDDATVVLVSDHGFHPDHLRPKSLPIKEEPAAPALEHSQYGIIVAKGPGIKKDERIYGASLIDMCPTILAMLGLPVGKDFDGKVLVSMFDEPIEIDVIDSWEDIEGPCGQHDKEVAMDAEAAKAEMQQLIDLGYIEDPGPNKEKAVEQTKKYNKYFLARSFVNGGKVEDAVPLYEELWEENRDNQRFGIRLVNCYMSVGRIEEAREVADDVFELKLSDSPNFHVLNGTLLMKEGKFKEALEEFNSVLEKAPKSPGINIQAAQGYMKLKQFGKAQEAINRELEVNYENPEAHRLLGEVFMKTRQPEKAAESFLNAIGLKYHFPMVHYDLGRVLIRLGHFEPAAQALEVAIAMFPRFKAARKQLIKLYENKLNDPKKAALAKEELEIVMNDEGSRIVVSGFQRSGTSLMMQMLQKGGLDLYSDDSRAANEFNPHGYFEHSAVKDIYHSKDFFKSIGEGQPVKILAGKLPFVHPRFDYKVIFMDRSITDRLLSLKKTKAGTNKKAAVSDTISLTAYAKNDIQAKRIEKWLDRQQKAKNVELCRVDYNTLLENPVKCVKEVNQFLGGHLNEEAMLTALDSALIESKETASTE